MENPQEKSESELRGKRPGAKLQKPGWGASLPTTIPGGALQGQVHTPPLFERQVRGWGAASQSRKLCILGKEFPVFGLAGQVYYTVTILVTSYLAETARPFSL